MQEDQITSRVMNLVVRGNSKRRLVISVLREKTKQTWPTHKPRSQFERVGSEAIE